MSNPLPREPEPDEFILNADHTGVRVWVPCDFDSVYRILTAGFPNEEILWCPEHPDPTLVTSLLLSDSKGIQRLLMLDGVAVMDGPAQDAQITAALGSPDFIGMAVFYRTSDRLWWDRFLDALTRVVPVYVDAR